ncbi:hypothetical protein M3689_02270 [Alkalihalophilus marmarensis]|uniref:Uncharacterized protein n=1 Tax=Alkalihalophilus marmarensis DSM 21297 TaxID=1188261 RepID=U6SR12_9BACI|nr:hypothetical protein [Alkalihalophilus marmarensis]ERN54053.1 hypothetical protein A33I_08770 [Alkalihalophilus marmarensis DSM 21297]MCM3488128.1 hypothetical protein [Alkalihalophilus marmarensis]
MTFIIPEWVYTLLNIPSKTIFTLLCTVLTVLFLKIFRIELNKWMVSIVFLIIMIPTQMFISNQYSQAWLHDHMTVITGSNEILEHSYENPVLLTTDDDLILFIEFPYEDVIPLQLTDDYSTNILLKPVTLEAESIRHLQQIHSNTTDVEFESQFFSIGYYLMDIIIPKLQNELENEAANLEVFLNEQQLNQKEVNELVKQHLHKVLDNTEKELFNLEIID